MEEVTSVLLIFASSILACLGWWFIKRHQKHQLFKKLGIPGPEPNFFTGNLFQLDEGSTPNEAISKWLKEYGDVVGYFVGEVPHIIIKDLDMLKQIFFTDFNVFTNRPGSFNSSTSSPNMSHLEGKRWSEIRSILTPTFTSGKIKLMMATVERKVDDMVQIIRESAENGEIIDIYQHAQALTLDVMAHCAFAMKTNCLKDPNDKLLLTVKEFYRFYRNNLPFVLSVMFPFLAPLMLIVDRYLMTAGRMLSFIIDHLRIALDIRRKNPEMKSNDFLQLVMDVNEKESKSRMTDEDIMSNALLFLLAGYESTSTSIAFTLHLLIKNYDVQEKLYQEIAECKDCSYDTIRSLRYLDQVYSESLRIYPPVPGFNSRSCSQDHQVGSITVPKGSIVFSPVWDIHHDPDLWPEPETFDPDRFSPENKTSIPSMAYQPFGEGPRNCIGARFAQLEAKLALFKLIKEFRLEVCEKTDDPMTLTCHTTMNINPAKGVYLKAVPRT